MKLLCALSAALLLFTSHALAELGGAPLAANSGLRIKSSALASSPKPNIYSVRKVSLMDDIEIREYVLPSGVVFGLAWNGSSKPDLSLLLGSYFSRYTSALTRPAMGRSPIAINDSDLVIQTGGQMNNFFGLAFLPALAPAGIQLSEVE